MEANIQQKIGRATKWSSITEIATRLVSPLVNIVLARLLVPSAFGIVATITMVISFAEIFTDAGFQKYIIQHEFKDEEELDKNTNVAFWTNIVVSIIICGVIFVFRDKIANIVGNDGLGDSISIASLLIIIAAFSSIQMARFKRELNFKTLFYVRIGAALIPLIITIPLAVLLRNYWALLIGNFATNIFNAVILTIKSRWRPKFFYSFAIFKEMFSFSAWTLLESVSIWLTSNIGIFIVGNHLNEYYLGLYKTSMSTINSYMGIITSALVPVLFSALSRYQNDDDNFKKTYYFFQKITAIFVIPMGVGIFLFSDLVTLVLLGDQWLEASGFIGIWGLTSAITIVLSHFASEVFRSKGNPKISLISQLIHMCILIPTILISIEYGFEVLYVSRSIVRIELILFSIIALKILYKFEILIVVKNIAPAGIASLIMCGVAILLKDLIANLLWQFVTIGICVLVYFVALFVLFPTVRKEIFELEFVQKLLKKSKSKTKSKM